MLKEIKITKPGGIRAEDSAVIAQTASRFKADTFIIKENKRVNAKSIMGLISLNMKKDDVIYLSVNGDEENEVLTQLLKLI